MYKDAHAKIRADPSHKPAEPKPDMKTKRWVVLTAAVALHSTAV